MTAPRLIRNRPLLAQRADLIGRPQADAEAAQRSASPWPFQPPIADEARTDCAARRVACAALLLSAGAMVASLAGLAHAWGFL